MFSESRPVWAKGRSKDRNLFLEFLIDLPAAADRVRLTASMAYQLFSGETLLAYGPARAGDGHFRVDEWSVTGLAALRVLVAGYYTSNFQYCLYPSFLNLEILDADGNVLIATGRDDIPCREYAPRLRWTDKFARQRLYTEVYDFFRPDGPAQELEILPDPIYLPRRVAPFSNADFEPVAVLSDLDVFRGEGPDDLGNGHSPFNNKLLWLQPGGAKYPEHYDWMLYTDALSLHFANPRPAADGPIPASTARIFAFDRDRAGQIALECTVADDTEIYLFIDELLTDGDVNPRRYNCLNACKFRLPAGRHSLMTFEAYTFRYLKVIVTRGSAEIHRVVLKEQAGVPTREVSFADANLQAIYDAAACTFRQNATDIFMDCPSRERAGWLCDSFFTGRSEYALTGGCTVETNFLENFWRHDEYLMPDAPKGIVPMLYPGATDYIDNGNSYIINWNLWLILEIEEYAFKRGGSKEVVDGLKDTVYGILSAMAGLENEYGLAEDMPGWVFVEWSRANDPDLICGVNFPSNMLYSGALEAAGHVYNDPALIEKAEKIRSTVREMSFNGRCFVDNAVRKDGKLVPNDVTTEVCQYYAFFFNAATPESHPALWDMVLNQFGPDRKNNNPCPDIPFANAFIGNYLRLDVLMRYGRYEQVLKEIEGYFSFMAEKSGTLWEFDTSRASCCHGFASLVGAWLIELKSLLNL